MDLKQALELLIKEAPKHVDGILTYQFYPLLDRDLDDVTRSEIWNTIRHFKQQSCDIEEAVRKVRIGLQFGTLIINTQQEPNGE